MKIKNIILGLILTSISLFSVELNISNIDKYPAEVNELYEYIIIVNNTNKGTAVIVDGGTIDIRANEHLAVVCNYSLNLIVEDSEVNVNCKKKISIFNKRIQ